MAGNGNRGPNDFRERNGRRRREPPIIDASATEVPLDAETPDGKPSGAASASAEPPSPAAEPASDPVLFGGARRPPESASTGTDEPVVVPSALDGEPAPGEPAPAGDSPPAPAAEEASAPPAPRLAISDAPTTDAPTAAVPASDAAAAEAGATPAESAAAPSADETVLPPAPEDPRRPATAGAEPPAASSEPPRTVPSSAAVPAAASRGGPLWLLGVSNLALLGALAWVLYAAPGRHGLADLRGKVAALEARPDASPLQGEVASLDKRLGAADADRQTLAKTVTDLTARLDAVAQAAQSAKADADKASTVAGAAQSDANKPAPTGAAAVATVGAVAALAAKLDGVDKSVASLSADQGRTAKALADLPKPVPPDFGPVNARLAGLDAGLAALGAKLNGTDARFNGFDAKVNAMDAKVNAFDARANGIDARANLLESKLNDEAAGLGRLQSAVANLPKVDLSPLQAAAAGLDKRVATIETALAPAKDGGRVTQARAVGSGDWSRATPIALVGQAVQRAVADGRPYASDIDTLKALGAEPEILAKLQPFAAKGVPSVSALKAQWGAVRGDVLAAVQPAAPASARDRFADSLRALVQVHQVGAVEGDDGGAVVSQVDAALDSGDVGGALAAWARLPPAGQAPSKAWADAAHGRLDAAGAAQALVSRAIATLGKTDD